VVEYDQRRAVRLQVVLEDYEDTCGRTERHPAAYELDDVDRSIQWLEHLPKDAPPQEAGRYLTTLQRQEGDRRVDGKLTALRDYAENKSNK
jgi:hypothetical protein